MLCCKFLPECSLELLLEQGANEGLQLSVAFAVFYNRCPVSRNLIYQFVRNDFAIEALESGPGYIGIIVKAE